MLKSKNAAMHATGNKGFIERNIVKSASGEDKKCIFT
jgi:hypothetical protein